MVSTSLQGTRGLSLILSLVAVTASAQTVLPSFFWGFTNYTSTSLPECGRLQIFVNPSGGTTAPKPPYTLFAYEAGGIPTRQTVGSDLTNLWWTVDHSSQSQLVLSMADAVGNAGGVSPKLYDVVPGLTTSCHAANPTSTVSLTTNATKSIQSCDILPLHMSGGKKPYTISIAPLSAPTTINFTLGAQFDTLDWINRASPNTQIITSVSDADGIYAGSTNLITTSGSTDLTCGNQQSTQIDSTAGQSSPGNQTSSSSNGSSSQSSSTKSSSTTTIVAVIVGGVVAIAVAAIALFICLRRRKQKRYSPVNVNNEYGLGGVRGEPIPGQTDQYLSAAEISPFVTAGGLGTPYSDNPQLQWSIDSRAPSEMSVGPAMQVKTASYYVPSVVSPGASSFAAQQSLPPSAFTPPPSSTVSSFDPYGRGLITPSGPLESTGSSIAGPSGGAAYAAYAGSVTDSDARMMGIAGPSSRSLVVANTTARDSTDEKQGPVPPAAPRESVYQHEDISDVVELPPAYKERTDL